MFINYLLIQELYKYKGKWLIINIIRKIKIF